MGSVHWSFKNGFNQYLLQAEANQVDKLVNLLREAYLKNGNWQFLQDNPHAWVNFLRQGLDQQHLPPKFSANPADSGPHPRHPARPQRGRRRPRRP